MLKRLFAWLDRLPSWLQPAMAGALILATLVAVRIVVGIPFLVAHPSHLGSLFYLFILATTAGALGGLAYSLIGRRLLAIPVVGRYLTGIVCVAGYLLPLILLIPRAVPNLSATDYEMFDLRKPVTRWIWSICTVFFGLVVGQTWFDDPRKPRRPSSKAR